MKASFFLLKRKKFSLLYQKERKYEPMKMPSKRRPQELNESTTSKNKKNTLNPTIIGKKPTGIIHQSKV